jgi:hypothetical protein
LAGSQRFPGRPGLAGRAGRLRRQRQHRLIAQSVTAFPRSRRTRRVREPRLREQIGQRHRFLGRPASARCVTWTLAQGEASLPFHYGATIFAPWVGTAWIGVQVETAFKTKNAVSPPFVSNGCALRTASGLPLLKARRPSGASAVSPRRASVPRDARLRGRRRS